MAPKPIDMVLAKSVLICIGQSSQGYTECGISSESALIACSVIEQVLMTWHYYDVFCFRLLVNLMQLS